ncbi:salicylate synthase [Pseudonocardia alni]|uniref:salicylate synthase n=1 Tax=Pseudonocardia alni TaxID=33907 RepID=UPI0027A681DA|nr:salicylate synthase [Pseudonocardia alni]
MSTTTEAAGPPRTDLAPTERTRSAADRIAGATAIARAVPDEDPYVLYERGDDVFLAAGTAAELVLDPDGLTVSSPAGTRHEPLGTDPLAQVAAALAAVGGTGWQAFGWASFELAHLLHGGELPAGTGTLLHLLLPRHRAHLHAGGADVDTADDAVARSWRDAILGAGPGAPRGGPPVTVDESARAEAYRGSVAAAVAEIAEDRFRKVILSRTVPVTEPVDLPATYRYGRAHNTPARSFLLRLGGLEAAGFSPETVVEVAADGTFSTQPLAGTRARSGEPGRDAELSDELRRDPKEIYEHAVSVQVAQDEVSQVSDPDAVVVEEFMRVVERGSVQHLASRVRGRLRPGATAWDALGRLFPAVTASGLPKAPACAAISRHEGARGLYSGAVLTVDHTGALDAALVLRAIYRAQGRTWLRAGAGIVGASTPERELEETREKLRSVSRFLVGEETP